MILNVRSRPVLLAAVAACLAASAACPPAQACQVPVFRFALERWPADPYRVVVEHSAPLTDEQQRLVDSLRGGSSGVAPANLEVELASQPVDSVASPRLVLKYPNSSERRDAVIAQLPLNVESVNTIRSSPSRAAVTRALAEGNSVVFLFLPIGDVEKDKMYRQQLEDHLKTEQQNLQLPQGVLEDPLLRQNTNVQLKLSFSIVDVNRDDPAEQVFVSMILGSESDLRNYVEPIVFPVFGRGRMLYALIGRGINEHTIADACGFLVGACSCQVKSLNPGVDLLFSLDWDILVGAPNGREAEPFDLTAMPAMSELVEDDEPVDGAPPDVTQPPMAGHSDDGAGPVVGQESPVSSVAPATSVLAHDGGSGDWALWKVALGAMVVVVVISSAAVLWVWAAGRRREAAP